MNGFDSTFPTAEGDPSRIVSPSTLNSNSDAPCAPFFAVTTTLVSLLERRTAKNR